MLQTFDIEVLEDIRAFTKSRKYPQFNDAQMQKWLEEAGIEYRQDHELGADAVRAIQSAVRSMQAGRMNPSIIMPTTL